MIDSAALFKEMSLDASKTYSVCTNDKEDMALNSPIRRDQYLLTLHLIGSAAPIRWKEWSWIFQEEDTKPWLWLAELHQQRILTLCLIGMASPMRRERHGPR